MVLQFSMKRCSEEKVHVSRFVSQSSNNHRLTSGQLAEIDRRLEIPSLSLVGIRNSLIIDRSMAIYDLYRSIKIVPSLSPLGVFAKVRPVTVVLCFLASRYTSDPVSWIVRTFRDRVSHKSRPNFVLDHRGN